MALMNTTRSMYGAPAAGAPTNSIYGAASAAGQRAAPSNSMYGGGGGQPAYPGAQNSMATMLAQKYPWMAPNLPTAVQGHPTGGVLQALPIQGAPVNPIYAPGATTPMSAAPLNPTSGIVGGNMLYAPGGVPTNMPYNAGVPGNYGPQYGNPYAEAGPVMVSPAGAVNQMAAYGGSGYTAAAPVTGRAVSGYAPNVTAAGNRVLAGNGGMSGVSNGGYSPNITRAGDRVMSGYGSSGYGSGGGSRGYGGNGFSGGGGGFIM
jgi:hypothetical protein